MDADKILKSEAAAKENEAQKTKTELINERIAGLELPEQPPVASDWNSADARNVNLTVGDAATGDIVGEGGKKRSEVPGSELAEGESKK